MNLYNINFPISYAVELTHACDNNCSACANVMKKGNNHLKNWKQIFDIIAPPENRKKQAQLFRITGGEPTLHPKFEEIIKYIDTFGIQYALFTTGRWKHIGVKKIIEIFSKCKNFVGFLISLHGSNSDAHNSFTESSKVAFSETCENIKKVANAGLEVFTNTVITKNSINQIDEIIALSKKLGATYSVFNRFLGTNHPLIPTEEELKKAIIKIEKLSKEGEHCYLGECVPYCFVENTSEGTNAGFEHCAISPEGNVRPDSLTKTIFGNILINNIEEIWNSEKAKKYRNTYPKKCLQCVELQRCRGAIRFYNIDFNMPGDPLIKEPIKEVAVSEIELHPDFKPIPNFKILKQKNEYLLARYNWSIKISKEQLPLINSFDGKTTLSEIQDKYGEDALNFVGELYQNSYIEFT